MKKALRIGHMRYRDDKMFDEHLSFIQRNLEDIDELTVFADFSHYGYWSPEYTAENVALLRIRIKDSKKVVPTVTTNENGGVNIMLTNISFDATGPLNVIVRSTAPFFFIDEKGRKKVATGQIENGETILSIENIKGWEYILLTNR